MFKLPKKQVRIDVSANNIFFIANNANTGSNINNFVNHCLFSKLNIPEFMHFII